MVRLRQSTLFYLVPVVGGLGIAFAVLLHFQLAKAADKVGLLKDWEFSEEVESLRKSRVGKVEAADFATSRPFEEVWTYYAKKFNYQEGYKPNHTHGGADGQSQVQILNSAPVGGAGRPSTTSAALIRRGSGENVTVFISRAKDEDETFFTLIVEGK